MLRKRTLRIIRVCRLGRVTGGSPSPGPASGSGLLLEGVPVAFLLLEDGFFLLLES